MSPQTPNKSQSAPAEPPLESSPGTAGTIPINDPSSATIPVRNAVSAFISHFHVRKGNEILWATGQHSVAELSNHGIEWKVLPSGSHALVQDVIYFDASHLKSHHQEKANLFGIAVFKNKKISASDESTSEEGVDQRGARMVSVGAIVDCGPKLNPWAQLASTLPHIEHLHKLAEAISSDPTCHRILEEWLEMHQYTSAFRPSLDRGISSSSSPVYVHDPLFQLPAVSNALGPFLPRLLKQLLTTSQRLLIYVPHGGSTMQAAAIAFTLGEIAHTGYNSTSAQDETSQQHDSDEMFTLYVRGIIGLHDITALQDEGNIRQVQTNRRASWIAWTSDKLLIEKCDLFDTLLDLTPILDSQGLGADSVDVSAPTVLPKVLRSSLSMVNGKMSATLVNLTWTTREFAVYRGLEERANLSATSIRRRSTTRSSVQTPASQNDNQNGSQELMKRKSSSPAPSTSTLLAFLRFWLSSLRILPQRWRMNLRASYGYVPLSIRSDGGIRASIMLLPDSDSESDDDNEETPNRQSVTSSSPQLARRSLDLGERNDYIDDPILAAVGAGSASSRRRRKSRTGLSQASTTQLVSEVSTQADMMHSASQTLRPPPDPRLSGSLRRDSRENLREAFESVSLAFSLFDSWSTWVSELVMEVQEMILDKVADEENLQSNSQNGAETSTIRQRRRSSCRPSSAANAQETTSLISQQGDQSAVLHVQSQEMLQVGLSSYNVTDIDLVTSIASNVTDLSLVVRRGWSVLSWFGW